MGTSAYSDSMRVNNLEEQSAMTYSRLIPHQYQRKRYRLFDSRTSVSQDPLDLSSLVDQCALITWDYLTMIVIWC